MSARQFMPCSAQRQVTRVGSCALSLDNRCMHRNSRIPAWVIALLLVSGGAARGQDAQENPEERKIELSEEAAAAKRIHYVAPEYPALARASRIEGTVKMSARIGPNGTVQALQTFSGHPLLIRAAIDAVNQWRYEPVLLDGKPAQVSTTISVVFSLSDKPSKPATPPAMQSPTGPSSGIIRLKNGRSIRADYIEEAGDKIEYTIGEGTYKINKSLVEEIVRGAPAVAASHPGRHSGKPGEAPASWYLYESTEDLRSECQTGEFSKHVHPEFQSSPVPVSQQEAEATCTSLRADMGMGYETVVDRAVQLEKELCSAGGGQFPPAQSLQGDLAAKFDEIMRIKAALRQEIKNMQASGALQDHAKANRVLIDDSRLAGNCGHGRG
jgi:TonB family protein